MDPLVVTVGLVILVLVCIGCVRWMGAHSLHYDANLQKELHDVDVKMEGLARARAELLRLQREGEASIKEHKRLHQMAYDNPERPCATCEATKALVESHRKGIEVLNEHTELLASRRQRILRDFGRS